jgi:hypothetical protein
MRFVTRVWKDMVGRIGGEEEEAHLLSDRARNTSTDNAGKLLATHGVKQTDTPADSEHHKDGEGANEPERHNDILLLASRAAPLGGLYGAIIVFTDIGFAGARVALAAQVAGILVCVGQDARTVTSAVAGHGLAGGQRGEAARENASERSSLVVGLVGVSVRGQGSLEVRSSLCNFGDQRSLLDVALLLSETSVGAECVI